MKKYYILFLLPLFLIPLVRADCGITNLGECVTDALSNFILSILNSPVQPLLDVVQVLLTQPVNINLFSSIWSIVVYILSLFYGILLMYVGFKFIISGHSVEKREKAKSDLANILIMIVLVQASFFIYSLLNQVIASVSTVVLNMVQPHFFLLTMDSFTNIGLEIILLLPYIITLLTTLILLTIRYVIVSSGVILFAIGIFFYFIEPLNHYGRLIINFLIATMSITFFYAIMLLASSMLMDIPVFQNYKIVIMIGAFSLINLVTLLIALFVIIKSALKVAGPVMKIVSLVGAVTGA